MVDRVGAGALLASLIGDAPAPLTAALTPRGMYVGEERSLRSTVPYPALEGYRGSPSTCMRGRQQGCGRGRCWNTAHHTQRGRWKKQLQMPVKAFADCPRQGRQQASPPAARRAGCMSSLDSVEVRTDCLCSTTHQLSLLDPRTQAPALRYSAARALASLALPTLLPAMLVSWPRSHLAPAP